VSYVALDYLCPECGVTFESFEKRANPASELPHCNSLAPRVLSSPMVLTQGVSVTRSSRSDGPPPGAIDTRPLADGMKHSDWKAKRRAERKATIRKRISSMVS
jgi:hypothetical protein